jgi:hypothetical protein
MTCSPKIKGSRPEVGQRRCNSHCFYWRDCLKELKIKSAPEDRETKWEKANRIALLTKSKKPFILNV